MSSPSIPSSATDNMSIWAKLLIFQMLIRSDATGTKLVPDLAESWDVIGRQADLHLPPAQERRPFPTARRSRPATSNSRSTACVTAEGSPWASMFPKMQIETPDDNTRRLQARSALGAVPRGYFGPRHLRPARGLFQASRRQGLRRQAHGLRAVPACRMDQGRPDRAAAQSAFLGPDPTLSRRGPVAGSGR